jgi:hypothetical protein
MMRSSIKSTKRLPSEFAGGIVFFRFWRAFKLRNGGGREAPAKQEHDSAMRRMLEERTNSNLMSVGVC